MRHRQRRGFVLVWFCVLFMVLLTIVGLALDYGYAFVVGHQLQNAADASALAGALKVRHPPSHVYAASEDLAFANTAAGNDVNVYEDDGDITIGTWADGAFSPGGTYPNAVKVIVRRNQDVADGPIALSFGPIFGTPEVGITRTAIAALQAGGGGPALLVLHPTNPKALELTGGSSLHVIGGPIHVNSNNTTQGAVRLGGNNTLTAPTLNVGGTVFDAGGATIDTTINTGVPPIADPLAYLVAPEPGPDQVMPSSALTSATLSPGRYTATLDVGPGKTRTLLPGIYFFDVAGGNPIALKINGGTLFGENVMIYLHRGSIDISSGSTITLRGITAGTYEGITLFQARTNTALAKMALSGTLDFTGTFYFPENRIQITANGGQVTARVIASELEFAGTGSIGITFPGYDDNDKAAYLVH